MKFPTFSKYFDMKNLPKAYVFDFDETLFKTTAKIIIRDAKNKKVLRRLAPHEFNHYVKNSNEILDLREFEDSNLLMKAEPIFNKIAFIDMKKADIEIEAGTNAVIYIVTARGTEVRNAIFKLLKKYKIRTIKIDNIMTIAQEIRAQNTTTSIKKHEIVSKIKQVSSSVEFYDDNQENIDAVKSIPGVVTKKV